MTDMEKQHWQILDEMRIALHNSGLSSVGEIFRDENDHLHWNDPYVSLMIGDKYAKGMSDKFTCHFTTDWRYADKICVTEFHWVADWLNEYERKHPGFKYRFVPACMMPLPQTVDVAGQREEIKPGFSHEGHLEMAK